MMEDTDMSEEEMTMEFLINCLKKKITPFLKNYEYMKKNYREILEKYQL